MRKSLLFMLAALASISASALDIDTIPPTLVSVNPASDSSVANRNFEVTFTYAQPVKVDTVKIMGGPRFSRIITQKILDMPSPSTEVTVTVNADEWGTPSSGEYMLEVTLASMYNENGDKYMVNEMVDDEEIYYNYTESVYYTSPDTTPAAFVNVDPDPAETTAWDAYMDGWGIIAFNFSNIVELTGEGAGATVTYYITGMDPEDFEIAAEDLWCDWDFWTGNYSVSVELPSMTEITETNLEELAISLAGVTYGGLPVSVDAVTYSSSSNRRSAPSISGVHGPQIESMTHIIYNMQGNKVCTGNVNNLPAGIYIVDGKKTIVK